MTDRSDGMRTLLVGLDAGCLSVLEPLLESGALPNVASVFEEGVFGALQSQVPPWTPSAWPSLYTGTNPGKHGVFGFLRFDGYDWDVVNATDVRARTLWEYLDYHGLTSVVVNAPVTYPPPDVDGAVVPGYMAPENPTCHPPGLLDELRAELGEYRVYAPFDGADDVGARIESYRSLVRMRGRAFRYLADKFDPDFGFVQFQQTDTVFHECPGDDRAVRAVYEAVDAELGEILDRCDPATVIVASDHGMGAYRGGEVRVNEVLREAGLVETKRGGEGMPSWNAIATERLQRNGEAESARNRTLSLALSALAKAGLTSQRIGRVLKTVGADQFVLDRVPNAVVRAATEQVDFPRSKAYMRSRVELGVRVNLEGREPCGVVPRSEYETVRDEIIECLRDVRTPSGEPVFERVDRREEHFHGPYVDEAVDVVTIPTDYDHFLTAQLRGDPIFPVPQEPWNHKFEGVVALAGEGVDAGATLDGATLFDVAPMVLAALGLPYDDDMDGGPLDPISSVGSRAYPPFDGNRTRATDDRAIEQRLAELGYLER
ncbi:alkaline phosphatase family protein [Halegenticoccus soli]|uniref:alkaline phosphatase family protein n=1 Tax=Halegenticoccus soli TaxID=1985678 RepID=UPI000C6D3478|nr:alkaline phosphatase family protein [Halegenticoccus soli]